MDRKTLKFPFTLDRPPDWTCPTCEKGVLRIAKESFFEAEVRRSRDHSHDAWEPEWIERVYTCQLICTNDQCKEVVVNCGVGSVDIDIEQDEYGGISQSYENFYRPKFFEPHLSLFHIPSDCPKTVSVPLNESFRLFFTSPSSAANSVRVAIEELLTELRIKRFDLVKGKRRPISLHRRIGLLPSKYASLKDLLIAIKWLGNAGSHGNSGDNAISQDDVMDSYELAEHILQQIYEPKTQKLVALAKKVNKKKGPSK